MATRREKALKAIFLTVLVSGLAATVAEASAAVCVRPGDEIAVNTRVMQSELMVAALACDQAADYNALVRKFQPELNAGGAALKRMFRGAYGASAEHQINRYVTVLANDAAQRSATEKDRFCAATAGIFVRVMDMDRAAFRAFVAGPEFAGRHRLAECSGREAAER